MDNLLIVLDPDNKKHLYEQIYDHIKKEIREGKLCYGERLPSARLLAQQLQISRSTVDLAYGVSGSETMSGIFCQSCGRTVSYHP